MAKDKSSSPKGKTKRTLSFHKATGQYYVWDGVAKKRAYFGTDEVEALRRYQDYKNGVTTEPKREAVTLRHAANYLLAAKDAAAKQESRSRRHWLDLKKAAKYTIAEFGQDKDVTSLRPSDFAQLRGAMAARFNATSLRREIANVRSIFNFAYKNDLIEHPVKFGTGFSMPSKPEIRAAKHARGKRVFEPKEFHRALDMASLHIRAMMLVGVNCGYGNSDIRKLCLSSLDLEQGWAEFPRPKTKVFRRAKLWSETIEAVKASIAKRPKEKDASLIDRVFITERGGAWGREESELEQGLSPYCAISPRFHKLLVNSGVYRKGLSFNSVRHCTESKGGRDQVAIDCVMGHDDGRMGNTYRDVVDEERLEDVANAIHAWLFGG